MSPFLITLIGRRSVWAVLSATVICIVPTAYATPLSLNAALAIAEQNSPELTANAAQIDAAQSAAIPAGSLPNPKVYAGLDNFPVTGSEAGQLTRDNMTMQKIGVMQDIPNAAKRRAQVEVSSAKVDVAEAQRPITRLKIRESTAIAWFNRYYLERKIALFDQLSAENKLLAQTVHAQIAAGRGQVADALLPQQEAAQLEDRRDELLRDLSKAKSALRRYLGSRGDGEADQSLSLDAPDLPIHEDHLHQHLHHHPELEAFTAESQLAAAKLSEAKSLKKSDMSIELSYGHRAPQFGDMVGVQVTFDLPIFSSRRIDPLITAAESEQADVNAQRAIMLRDHTTMLENDLADYTAFSRQLERATTTEISLATQKVALQLASYQAGKADLGMVLAARRELIEQRLKVITLQNMRAVTAAQLYFAYGDDSIDNSIPSLGLQGADIK